MEWHRNLQIVISVEDKLPFLEQPIPAMPVPAEGQSMKNLKNQKKKSFKAAKRNQRKSKAKMGNALVPAPSFAPKPKNPPTPKKDNPAKDAICHQCGEVELYSFLSTSWVYDTSCGSHIYITTQSLRGSKKLKPRALCLYVGDGHSATIEAIVEFHLCLPSGLV
uniref:Uncharacterized protein n=1 Tax=Tanacetum cinerariifolium TaxID=118510 RepID=A0A699J938_TANCI|nr:hypothetical protein [Tanacetum cinerariifolium]